MYNNTNKMNKLKVYIPHEIKKPLIWFLLASVIGIIIQSVEEEKLVFIDFFCKNYMSVLSAIIDSFVGISMILGIGTVLIALLSVFYYMIMTICLLIIIYHLILTLNKKNTQKILLYLIILIGGIFLFSNFLLNGKINLNNQCPEGLIPTKINVLDSEYKVSYNELSNKKRLEDNWSDGLPIIGSKYGTDCVKGSQEGENINHYYCRNLKYTKSETPINLEGNIGKTQTTNYTIDLEVIPLGKVLEGATTFYGTTIIKRENFDEEILKIYKGEFNIKLRERTSISLTEIYDTFMNYSVISSKCVKQ